ncbi:hypothetical protein GTZ97_06455 [Aquabacterium fontiphilum]|uniref:hemagglutinin repeat-containing protein n=1 Tax=Aquabacterium fontiphilum TaxID=450365 RepID=UPI001377A391|nr:hypothetical protein [Aquabacterium fontiphilum]
MARGPTQDRYSERSENKSSSAAVGVKIGSEGFGFSASGSVGRGRGDGDDVVQVNTQVQAGQTVGMSSGGDTTLQGAVVQGQQVQANVGGNLTVQSLQDTSTYSSRQQNVSGSVTIGPGAGSGGQASYSSSKVNSDYASVVQRSGIEAGDGGFQVNVQGQTTLQGGVIASTDKAVDEGRNSLNTQGLSLSDIDNRASYEAKAVSVSVGTSAGQNSAGIGQASDSAASTTTAGVSGLAGDQSVRTGDASQGLDRIFDRERVTQDVTAQATVMAEFGKQASKLIGDVADAKLKESLDLRSKALQAREQGDAARADALDAQAQALDAAWGDQGTMRLLAHTVVGGLTGNVAGAAGAAASTAGSPLLLDALANAGLDPDLARGLAALASTALGAAVGGSTGAMAAFNEVSNNFLNHQQQRQYAQALTACRTDSECERRVHEQYQRLSLQNNMALLKAQALCEKTGDCEERDRLYARGTGWGEGLKQVQTATDPEAALVTPALDRINAKEVEALVLRMLTQEVVRLGPVSTFDALGNVSIDPARYVSAIDNRNALTAMGVAMAPTLLLPGPEDLVVGAALATKAGQKIAEVVMQSGQKVWRFVDGSTARVGSQEAEQIARARVENNVFRDGSIAAPDKTMSPTGPWKPAQLLSPAEADARVQSLLPPGAIVTSKESADALNAAILKENLNFKPPYIANTEAVIFKNSQPTDFVRVYVEGGRSGQADTWVMPAAEIKGLSAEQIASKYALPQVPTHITDVKVPAGVQMRATSAGVSTSSPAAAWVATVEVAVCSLRC